MFSSYGKFFGFFCSVEWPQFQFWPVFFLVPSPAVLWCRLAASATLSLDSCGYKMGYRAVPPAGSRGKPCRRDEAKRESISSFDIIKSRIIYNILYKIQHKFPEVPGTADLCCAIFCILYATQKLCKFDNKCTTSIDLSLMADGCRFEKHSAFLRFHWQMKTPVSTKWVPESYSCGRQVICGIFLDHTPSKNVPN